MSRRVTIPGVTFTDADALPAVRTDQLFPAAGALMLVDPTHPVTPWDAGVPANDATVPNIAWEQCAAVLGSGDADTLAAEVYNVGLSTTAGLVERTTKGGLHAVISPTEVFANANAGFNVAVPDAIFDYTQSNPTNKYYFSMWFQVTRAATLDGNHKLFSAINTDSQFLQAFTQTATLNSGTLDTASAVDDTVGGNRFRNVANTPGETYGSDTVSGGTAATLPGHRSVFLVGNRHNVNGNSSSGARRGKGGSRILYRAYLEDLTVSGRTYAQVTAIDQAMFTAVCDTAGGRYYGDEFTDPATIS